MKYQVICPSFLRNFVKRKLYHLEKDIQPLCTKNSTRLEIPQSDWLNYCILTAS